MGPKNPSDSLEISPYVESGESICWACCVILSLGSRVAWPWFCRRWRCYLGRQRLGGYGSVISMVLIWVGGFLKMDGQMENLVNILWTSYDIRNLGVPPFSETSTWGDGPKWTSGFVPKTLGIPQHGHGIIGKMMITGILWLHFRTPKMERCERGPYTGMIWMTDHHKWG